MQNHTVVAELDSSKLARSVRGELEHLFLSHAKEVDASKDHDPWMVCQACTRLAKRYGFRWNKELGLPFSNWPMCNDLPVVVQEGYTVVAHAGYGAGFGDVPKYLRKCGAKIQILDVPTITSSFALPNGQMGDILVGQLVRYFEQRKTIKALIDWQASPWAGRPVPGGGAQVAWRCSESSFEFHTPFALADLAKIRDYLKKQGAKRIRVVLCSKAELTRIRRGLEVVSKKQDGHPFNWQEFEKILKKSTVVTKGKQPYGFALVLRGKKSIAHSLGLQHWDIVRSVNGVPLVESRFSEIRKKVEKSKKVVLKIERKRKRLLVEMTSKL